MSTLRKTACLLITIICCIGVSHVYGQKVSTSDFRVLSQPADRDVPFDITDEGVVKPVEFGADLAWASEQNFRRVILFTGKDRVAIVRGSFQPTHALVNGELHQEQLDDLNYRINLINRYAGSGTRLTLNSDHPSVDSWYVGNAANWEALIQVTAEHFIDAGHEVITIAPFNEPDYWQTGQGTIQDFFNITLRLRQNSFFDDMRISGGNTLNNDVALEWYNYLVPAGVDEGNTHQLAGSFDTYAAFFEAVRANGHHATADEMHNVMDAIVGQEYGLQTGIWWGPAELARGELATAMDGARIGYAEHRPNWTAAAVYRREDGKVQAFCGESERQAVTTTYKYISKDRPVFYDGKGPMYEFVLEMPGAPNASYYQDPAYHSNAERVINITWGADIQPVIDGQYVLVNRNSGMVMETSGTNQGAGIRQANHSGSSSQLWNVTPVSSRIGGDFSYYHVKPSFDNNLTLDIINFSLDDGAGIQLYGSTNSGNQQWYLDYAEDGWFYIRSRESSYCLEVSNASTVSGTKIVQGRPDGSEAQQWRLIPVDAAFEFTAPYENNSLEATGQPESIMLEWSTNPETDIKGYTILRSEQADGEYWTIATNVNANILVDNTIDVGKEYFYKLRVEDYSLNRTTSTDVVSAAATGEDGLVLHYEFEETLIDSSPQLFNAIASDEITYAAGKIGDLSASLGANNEYIQLPATIVDYNEITIAAWVKWDGGNADQKIFDFGNGPEERMYLTPSSAGGQLQFSIVANGSSDDIIAESLQSDEWVHIAITINELASWLYINGEEKVVKLLSNNPADFNPVINYIGKSHNATDPVFNGSIDDFRIYNYLMEPDEVVQLAGNAEPILAVEDLKFSVYPNPVHELINISGVSDASQVMLYTINGSGVFNQSIKSDNIQLNVSQLPAGVYVLKVIAGDVVKTRKILIDHH
jgi:hypothetical protein